MSDDGTKRAGEATPEDPAPVTGGKTWLWLTTALGVAFMGALVGSWWDELRDDPQTTMVLCVVVVLWAVFQASSYLWQSSLARVDLGDEAERLGPSWPGGLLSLGVQRRLPEGAAETLADQALGRLKAPSWLGLGATTLISLGLAGTFLGLSLGLIDALPFLDGPMPPDDVAVVCSPDFASTYKDVECAINALLAGAKLAFIKSLLGIFLALLWNFRLQEVHRAEDAVRDGMLQRLNRRFPPTTPEALLAQHLVKLDGFQTELGALRKDAQKLDTRRNELLEALRAQEEASLATVLKELKALHKTVADLGEAMPEQIGSHAGTHVGTTLQPKLAELSQVLQTLGTTGKEAIGDAFKDNMGREVGELRTALLNVTSAMTQLPGLIADGSRRATETLKEASGTGARELSSAATEMATQAHAAGASVKELREVLRETQALVDALRSGGAELSTSFERVTGPLRALPDTLESARSGIAEAGTAAKSAAEGLGWSGQQAATALSDAAGKLAASAEEAGSALSQGAATAGANLSSATSEAGATLSGAATQAGRVMQAGGAQLAGQVESAGKVLQEGITTELASIRDALRTQRDAQHAAMEAWKAERQAVLDGEEVARKRVTDLQTAASSFRDSVDALRVSCQATVEKLESVAGTQQAGADRAIEELLAAVGAFSRALEQNEQTIKDAGLQSVATTEQVTAAAARQVAKALTDGAEGLQQAMTRARELGDAIAAHSVVLQQSLEAANVSAESLEAHGRVLVDSGKALRSELEGVAVPLTLVRGGLEKVTPALDSATRSIAEEGKTLSGLGESLKAHAEVLERQTEGQIRILEARTSELQGLHEKLGSQWVGHVQRMAEAHEKVKSAWQEAMRSATVGLEDNAKHVATYAERVEKALGLNHTVTGLGDSLFEVSGALGELTPVLKDLTGEVSHLRTRVDRLEERDG